jgi:dTDP-4-amino-4,6-dideoxygalactose transaminase
MPALERTLYSGYIGQGPRVDEFEDALGAYLGGRNVLTVNSGTSALQLAMRLAGVAGGEVITTPMTCTATNMPILAEGARIVWADIDPTSGNIDPADVERKITRSTRAIVCVHWGGNPCDMAALSSIGKRYGIPIIEDAAHAWGARWEQRRLGDNTADLTCFSLQAIKHITTVDGGVLVARDSEAYRRGKLLRWYGIDREADRKDMRCEEDVLEWGHKWHMNDVAATIGLVQLGHLDRIVEDQRRKAAYYAREIPIPSARILPPAESSSWLHTLLLPNRERRQAFMEHLRLRGIMSSQVHARNDSHTCFADFHRSPLPGVSEFCDRMVCIPVHWALGASECVAIRDACVEFADGRRSGLRVMEG